MIPEIIAEIYLMICVAFCAGKDATSYRLKDHNASGQLVSNRIKRWHRDGVVMYGLYVLPVAYFITPWLIIAALPIRGYAFNPLFNYWAGLQITYLGGTAWFDRLFIKIFGQHGALKQSIAFMILLILLNVLYGTYT